MATSKKKEEVKVEDVENKEVEKEQKEIKEKQIKENKKLEAYKKALEDLDKKWKKKLGTKDSVVSLLPDMNADVEKFSSGSVVIDNIIGGGFPKGRIIEIFGPEACLFEDTKITYKKNGKINNKPIKALFTEFKTSEDKFLVKSIDEDDVFFFNPVFKVVKSGTKECFELTTKTDDKIQASKDHKFYIGKGKYLPLEDLKVGDKLFVDSEKDKAEETEIVSIENKGMKETYDIRCFSPYNNYVANNFVVHNSGKTSIALTAVGNVQKQGGNCFFIDVEQALDPVYARKLGVNLDELGFAQPSIAEEALQLMADLIVTDQIDLIVLDSVAALMPKAQYDEEIGKQTMALLARIMSQSLPKFTKLCREHDCSVIFINQVRDNVGIMFGAKTTTPGGKALKFYASQRLDIRRVRQIKDGDDTIGTEVKVKCVKNKVSVPYGEGTTVLTFAQGINRVEELLIVGQEVGTIVQKGQTFYLPSQDETLLDKEKYPFSEDGYKLAVYQKVLRETLTEDKDVFNLVSKRVASKLKEVTEHR